MAVGKCKECGGQVASSAKACPHCGAKVPKKVGVIGWAFVLLVVLPIAWKIGGGMSDSPSVADAPSSNATASGRSGSSPSEPVNTWQQSKYSDDMTDNEISVVSLRSEGSTLFDSPYKVRGGSYLHLSFREKAGKLDAYMRVDRGQMLCSVIECKFNLRVGEGPVQTWTGLRASDNSHDIMFVRDARQLEEIVRRGERLRIGIEFHRAGTRVFEFDVKGYPGTN